MSDLTFKRRFYLSSLAWKEIPREEVPSGLSDEDCIVGIFWQEAIEPDVEINAEMVYEEGEEKGLVWNITVGNFCGNEGNPEWALAVAEHLVWDRHGIPPNLRG